MGAYSVGLDVHSRETVFVIQDEAGTIIGRGSVPTTPEGFARMCGDHHLPRGTVAALETGTSAFYAARALAARELTPIVVDAHEVRRKAHRPAQKSDRRDAFELCDGIRVGRYCSIVHIPSPAISMLRTTLSRRRHFVRLQTAEVNAAKRLLRGAGWRDGTRASLRNAASWERLINALAVIPELQTHVRFHYAVWKQASAQVRDVDHLLGELARTHRDDVRRLETVPGVGPIVALTAIAVFGDVQRFGTAKHVASYAGLVPSTYQSGDCDRHGHITKRGSAELRTMLCEAAHHARRPSHPLHPYFRKLCVRRGYKTAVVAVAHRLCRLLWAMLRDGTDFSADPPRHRGGLIHADRHASVSSHAEIGGTSHARLMPESRTPTLCRPRGACDPVLTRGPRAQETVWGQALRNAMWGDLDPEWTAGDDTGLTAHDLCNRPDLATAQIGTGSPLTSRLHGRVRYPPTLRAKPTLERAGAPTYRNG